MQPIFIETESFSEKGGWVTDTASMELLHSAYLMAHGMGRPVADAATEFIVADGGTYYVWALTRDWTAVWDVKDPAGKFTIKINDVELRNVLGTNGKAWAWQLAGTISLSKGVHKIALHDMTGFNARCDAVYISTASKAPENDISAIDAMRKAYVWKEIKEHPATYDLVVVGGGIAGICTALSALRSGVSVALIHDREILGGCNSSEVRVCMGGMTHQPPYTALGTIVKEIGPVMGTPRQYGKEYFEDNRKRFAFEVPEGKRADYQIFTNAFVTDIVRQDKTLQSVICTDTRTGEKTKISGKCFADCSGDGILARKMGCEVMYGREGRDMFDESLAPEAPEKLVMGHSIRWYSEETAEYSDFPDIDWNLAFTDASCLNCTAGDWEQETGFTRDTVSEIEYIRDFGLRAIYANWAFQKHHFKDKEKFAKRRIAWVSPIGGKREGYRVRGDYVLTQNDIENAVMHEDGTACLTWNIDMHFPEPTNQAEFGEAFRSFAYHRGVEKPYPVPYRCLYARDADNLFLGGRLISASHVAFSAVRVMRTLGCLGEVVGLASSICKKYNCTPRAVYTDHPDALKEALRRGVDSPDAFNCGVGCYEFYHFKDIGSWWLHRGDAEQPEEIEKFKKGVASLGLSHKFPMPATWKKHL